MCLSSCKAAAKSRMARGCSGGALLGGRGKQVEADRGVPQPKALAGSKRPGQAQTAVCQWLKALCFPSQSTEDLHPSRIQFSFGLQLVQGELKGTRPCMYPQVEECRQEGSPGHRVVVASSRTRAPDWAGGLLAPPQGLSLREAVEEGEVP